MNAERNIEMMTRTITIIIALTIAAASTALAVGAETAGTKDAKGGVCVFALKDAPVDKLGEWSPVQSLKCGEFSSLYARCSFDMKVPEVLEMSHISATIKTAFLEKSAEFNFDGVFEAEDGSVMKFAIIDKKSEFKTAASDLCAVPEGKKIDKPVLELVVSAAKLDKIEKVEVKNEKTGAVSTTDRKVFSYKPLASGTLILAPAAKKQLEKPDWNTLKNALRQYLTDNFGDSLIDAMPAEDPKQVAGSGPALLKWPLTAIIERGDGSRITCSISEAIFKAADGSVEVFSLTYDYSADCQ